MVNHVSRENILELWQQAGQAHWMPVSGRSMLPLIRPGDAVLVQYGHTALRRGDICVFRQGDALVVHRVLQVTPGQHGMLLLTRGDAAAHTDRPVPAQVLVGRVQALRRTGQSISLDTPVARMGGWMLATLSLTRTDRSGWIARMGGRFARPLRQAYVALVWLAGRAR